MKPRTTHTSFYTGSKIRIVMRDGNVLIRKYKESKGNYIITYEEKIPIHLIRVINYYKPLKHEQ